MKVYEALARAFVAEGTTAVFGMMGDANMYWMNELDKLGVRQFEVRHEGGGLAMADGWARTDGNPGVCTTTSGPGVAQLATTLLVASRARTPMVAFVGEAPTGDDSYVRARTESRPILLSAPMNIQQQSIDDDEYVPSTELLGHGEPTFPNPASVFVQADATLGVQELHRTLVDRGVHRTGYRTPEVKERLTTAFEDNEVYQLEPGTIDPRDLCRILDERIPPEIGLIIGGGQNICFSTILMICTRRMLLANQHFGCIGQGLTTAIGAMVATGDKPAFLVEGDAGFMMHLPEFETAVRYGLPILVVLFNDQLLGAEYHKAVAEGLNAELARVSTPDLGAVGRALGGRGTLVTDLDTLRAAIDEYVADPAPTIIDARISTSVISIPYRRLHFGQDA